MYICLTSIMSSSFTILLLLSIIWLLFGESISPGFFCHGSIHTAVGGCIPIEKEALLEFKRGLIDPSKRLASWDANGDCCTWDAVICHNITGRVLELHLRTPTLQEYAVSVGGSSLHAYYWLDDYDAEVRPTMFGGMVSRSLLKLEYLRYLDLSNNDFGGISIPEFLGSMESLRYLNLSRAGFGGMIPPQLGNISGLQYLNIQGDKFHLSKIYAENMDWISGLSSLEFLDLSYVNLSSASNWAKVVNTLPSLVELNLSSCGLLHIPPLLDTNLSSLSVLDLSWNQFEGLVPSWVFGLTTLTSLNLASNSFQGPFPNGLQNLTSLRELDLSSNHFNSSIPDWLYCFRHLELLNLGCNALQDRIPSSIRDMTSLVNLDLSNNEKLEADRQVLRTFKKPCNLKSLDLSGINLKLEINEVFEILLGCIVDGLESLSLLKCNLSGSVSENHLSQFKNMVLLKLSENSISGPIPVSIGELTGLVYLDLSHNKLNGTLPASFGGLTRLQIVLIDGNLLEGNVSEIHFLNLIQLKVFAAYGNQLSLRVSPGWTPPLRLQALRLGSWANSGPEFPSWLCSLKHLSDLDLSNTGISSTIPSCFSNLSSNLPTIISVSGLPSAFDLSSNHIKGPLPPFLLNPGVLDLSNNSISGSLSNFLCHDLNVSKNLQLLNLEGNLLSGEIPDCWESWPNLAAVNLNNNNLSGRIPKSIGALSSLKLLHLRNNNLVGDIPATLQNCTELETLDLSENGLAGSIPTWIGKSFSKLIALDLHANELQGGIPEELCRVTSLHILDLSYNNLSGAIPRCINNFTAMLRAENCTSGTLHVYTNASISYDFIVVSMLVGMKGGRREYTNNLGFVRSIDLSRNQLSGEIPSQITSLAGLQSLNLSQNLLIGRIPDNIGSMKTLESLDLSLNKISGKIPQSMSSLSFLNHLNLSNNKLSGMIPVGTQLQSFNASCFMGNEELCGPPLTMNCSKDNVHEVAPGSGGDGGKHGGDRVNIDWFYVSVGFGYIVGFWATVGPLFLSRRWRHAYFHFLNYLWDKVWWGFIRVFVLRWL